MTSASIIGYGKLGQALSQAFHQLGTLNQVYNRSAPKLREAPKGISTTISLSELMPSDIYFLTVADDAIASISGSITPYIPREALVVHCSGALPSSILNNHKNYGFFYPLQTFSSSDPLQFRAIPIYTFANHFEKQNILDSLVESLDAKLRSINDQQKLALHTAAVFANNFTNHLIGLSEHICNEHRLEFHDLLPLIQRTYIKLEKMSALEAQTGPAVRNDQQTIQRHLDFLENYPDDWRRIYQLCSQGINPNLDLL